MLRTVISLKTEDKLWLDEKAHAEHVAMTEVVRRAIKHYRQCMELHTDSSLDALLKKTSGVWTAGDGLSYQRKIRSDWEK